MTARTVPAPVVVRTTEDLVTVALPGKGPHDRELRQAARKIAAGAAHTIVGAAQNPRTGKVDDRVVTLVDYAPITRRQAGAAPAAAPAAAPVSDDAAKLAAKIARLQAQLDTLTGATPAREVPPVIAKRIAASHALTCKTCRDLRVVRGVGEGKGKHYRTPAGAAAATAGGRSQKCPACKGKGAVRAA